MIEQTSLDAFREALGERALRQRMVYDALWSGAKNDRMIAADTGLPINQVTPRRGELVAKGLVVADGFEPCPFSGVRTTFWRIDGSWP